MRVSIWTTHPLETTELLIVVGLVVILVLFIFLLLFFRLGSLPLSFLFIGGGVCITSSTFPSGLLSFLLALASLRSNLLGGPVTPDIRDSLHFALLSQVLSLLLLLLHLETLRRRLKLLLIHNEKVAGAPLGKVRLS